MKVLSAIALGVFALCVITFKSVASRPKLKPTAVTPFDWQQFLPGGKFYNSKLSPHVLIISVLFLQPVQYNMDNV